ncbi:MAG: hypothetical protein ACTSRG_02135 [Candidatus Helarchaeota archaeon]
MGAKIKVCDSGLISNIWIINKNNSLCVLQRNYGKANEIDKDLFSGFTTAFFNFSEEISGEHIKSVTMGSFKFFYKNTDSMILTITADPVLNEDDVSPLMSDIISQFINQGFEEKLTHGGINENLFLPFNETLDAIVENAINDLQAIVIERQTQDKGNASSKVAVQKRVTSLLESVKFEKPKTLTDQEAKDYKDKIMETLENAEYAINYSEFKEASIYYGVVAGLFDDLGSHDKAQIFREFANKLKEMAIYKEEILIQEVEAAKVVKKTKSVVPVEITPIIDIGSIDDDKIKDIMSKAFQAEVAKRYQEAITYYNSASGLFLINRMPDNSNKCSEKIKELVKKQQLEPQAETQSTLPSSSEFDAVGQLPPTQEKIMSHKSEDLIIPEKSISDEIIKNLLKNAALAENLELYDKAIKFYSEVSEKFAANNDIKNKQLCVEKIDELNKKVPVEDRAKGIGMREQEEKLLIPEEKIANEELKNLLKNAALAEKLELYNKALRFYEEAVEKFVELKDNKNEIVCKKKISELSKKLKIEQRVEEFSPIIPLETIEDPKIKRNLQKAYEAERNKKFKQASLFYNIATGLFSAKNDRVNAELCSKTAKKLNELN